MRIILNGKRRQKTHQQYGRIKRQLKERRTNTRERSSDERKVKVEVTHVTGKGHAFC